MSIIEYGVVDEKGIVFYTCNNINRLLYYVGLPLKQPQMIKYNITMKATA